MGTSLRRRRLAAGLTLAEVSERSGVAVPQLSRIENGRVDPRISTVVRILEVTDGELADLDIRPGSVVPIAQMLRHRTENQARLVAASIAPSDPERRLDARERAGEDVWAERMVLGSE